jgi:hypothetical protein
MPELRHAVSDESMDGTDVEVPNRARALALDILHRIRPVCAHMPDAELLTLTTRMAMVELHYFETAALETAPRRRAAHG